MKVKLMLVLLGFLLIALTGVCFCGPKEVCVRSGEMVALQCPPFGAQNHSETKLIWNSHTAQEMALSSNTSSAELRRMGVLLHGRSLVILSAAVNHQGNYSCSSRDGSGQFWFRLTVFTTPSRECEARTTYRTTCYTQESCKLNCPEVNIPDVNTPNMTSNDILWHKRGNSSPISGYFTSVEEKDSGAYICTRSYLYNQHQYNMTSTVVLDVEPNKKAEKSAVIVSPHENDVIHVDLEFDDLSWMSGNSLVEMNESLPVFLNITSYRNDNGEKINTTALLVFKKVTKEDLLKTYTCKLESEDQPSSSVTVTLAQKVRPSYVSLAVCSVCIVVVMILITIVYIKLKIPITLFLRDTLGCHRSTLGSVLFYSLSSMHIIVISDESSDKAVLYCLLDGKSYDAFLMCYESTDAGLNEDDRDKLKTVLEKFGYSLCLYDRDVLPGKAVSEAVLDCIEQSRTALLVPTSSDPGLGSSLLSVIYSALVERKTHLVFITTESTEKSRSGSVPEALQLLSEAGDCVTWKGEHSMMPSSSFWKRLRYHLPAPQHATKFRLLNGSGIEL
ncbi:interleukin-18 receptor 1-like isoform X2 [Cheilinus undulatus]|uniref:interleukin-18 receptor 1-like isoform X2 n=1 Tax=Cheilinus undulatus TaxID=241271 RepID=UPI001BD3FDC4|nr:interleukin-18 receptor 1-like isoform X2 [Cheilinus undulatus]